MNKNPQNTALKRWFRRIGVTILAFLLIAVVLRLSLKTGFVREWAKGIIVSTANKQLNGQLSIDHLSGDLWDDITASGMRLIRQDTLASIDSMHVKYNLWPLIKGQLEMSELGIYQPKVNLRQQQGGWNVQDLLKESSDTASTSSIAIRVNDLNLKNGTIAVTSDSLPIGPNFSVNNLTIASSLGYSNEDFEFNLQDLTFDVDGTKLDNQLQVATSAQGQKSEINLEKLVLATGNSLIRGSAFFSVRDSSIRLNAEASPISWKDIISYSRDFPLRRNIKLNLSLTGRPQNFNLTLNAQADGLDSLTLGGRFLWKSGLVLKQFTAGADYINPHIFLADTTLPILHHASLAFNGTINSQHYQQGSGTLQFSADQIMQASYQLDEFSGKGELKEATAMLHLKARQQNQEVTSNINAENIWSEDPSVQMNIKASHIDPSYWTQDTTYKGDLAFSGHIAGNGWYPNKRPWNYSLSLSGDLMGQPIASLSANGKASSINASIDALLRIRDGEIATHADVRQITSTPSYDFKIESRDFDVAALAGIKNFPTALNGVFKGKGEGINPAQMQLSSSLKIDSSLVNDEYIYNFISDFSIRDSVAVIDDAGLHSTIADGSFGLQMNVLRRFDSNNELSMKLKLKDISTLAPLFDVDSLGAEGSLSGKLSPDRNERLAFNGHFDLSNLRYNDLFAAESASGTVKASFLKHLRYMADLDLGSPTFSGLQLQDLHFLTNGDYSDPKAAGNYDLQFSGTKQGRIKLAGRYVKDGENISIKTDTLNIASNYRTLRLEDSFELSIRGDTISMDTMRVSDKDQSAYFEMGLPIIRNNEQRGFIEGKALNLTVIQDCLLGESYLDGMLSGGFQIVRKDTNLQAGGDILLSDINYQGVRVDSLEIQNHIENNRLKGKLSLRDDGKLLAEGTADLPFKLGDPKLFPVSFFDQPVSGQFHFSKVNITQFQPLFDKVGIENTKGIFSFRGQLTGQAGIPQFTAKATLNNAKLSGVPVDSVTIGMNYDHEDSKLDLNASVLSLHQKMAQIISTVPLFIDMKTFNVDLPQPDDSISVEAETHDFNLAALNDFVNRQTVRNIAGNLNGTVHIMGAVNDLKTRGQLVLRNGAFRLVPAGIRLEDMRSTVDFMPNQIRVNNFSTKSGRGRLNANGKIALKELIPGDINFDINAQNFRIANTSKYNAVISMDTKAGGSFTQPKVSGSINVVSGFLELQNFGEKSVESVQLDSTEQQTTDFSAYDSLSLDLDLSFNPRFYIRNKRYLEMQVALDGTVDLLKKPAKDLQMFGTINTANGYARPLGKEFKLEEGAVTFIGDPTNPQLMVKTRYKPPQPQQEIVIWYVIEGTVENPKFKYESQPPMELENIISYTLFGQPFYALDSWEQVVTKSGSNTTVKDVALDVLLDRVETLATKKLGIDVVKIDNSRANGENGTSITTGWYLNPKVFFAIQNVITGSTPTTGFELEYLLRKNLKLIIRQGNGIRQGIDFKWNYDY